MTYLGTWAFLVLTLCWLSSTNTQVLRRPDLLSSKGKPLITKAGLKTVWTRLADRLSTVVADTLMITISPAWEYTGHFYDLYINAKENSKLTGDRMKLLMLTLPFIVSDLIALEVNAIYPSYTRVMPSINCSYYGRSRSSMQRLIGQGLARGCTAYHTSPTPVTRSRRPSSSEWRNIVSCWRRLLDTDLARLQEMAVDPW